MEMWPLLSYPNLDTHCAIIEGYSDNRICISTHRNYTFIYVVKESYLSGFKYIFYKDKEV